MTTPPREPPQPAPLFDSLADLVIEGEDELSGDWTTPHSAFAACRQITMEHLDRALPELFEAAHQHLFDQAAAAPSNDLQQALFDATQEVHRLQTAVATGFMGALQRDFDAVWQPEVERQPTTRVQRDIGDLSLVDSQALDDEVQVVGILQQAMPSFRGREFELATRLGELLPEPVSEETMPVGVRNVCARFLDAVANLGADRHTRRALFRGLAYVLIPALEKLQEAMNGKLAAAGILPVVERRPVVQAATTKPASEAAGDGAASRSGRADATLSTPPAESAAAAAPGRAAPAAVGGPGSRAGAASATQPLTGALHAAHHLLGYNRALAAGQSPDLTAAAQPNARVLPLLELVLAQIQASRVAESWGERGAFSFGARLQAELEQYGISVVDAAARDTIEVVSDLFDTLLADPLVEARARAWLRRVAIPVQRVALGDGSFFAGLAHPARDMLDRLARVAVGTSDEDARTAALRAQVSDAVRVLLDGGSVEHEAFATAAASIERVLQAQAAVRDSRVQRAVQQLLAEAAPAGQAAAPGPSGALRADDVVILQQHGLTQRAVLAWVAPGASRYLFVDGLGRPLATADTATLDRAMQQGSVRRAEMARMHVVDRAMCAVLQHIHEQLEDQASRDPVTGLFSEQWMAREVERVLGLAPAEGTYHHLCMLRLSSHAAIEQHAGSAAAGALIKQYAGVIERQIADGGVAARVDGDTFMLLLPGARRQDVEVLMRRHLRSVELAVCSFKGTALPLRARIGVLALGAGLDDPAAALAAARRTLGQVHGDGELYIEPQPLSGAAEVPDSVSVRSYIDAGRLALRGQRIEPTRRGSDALPYYEVLLGVRRDDGSLAPPGDVVLAAERRGEVGVLDRWVVETALAWMGANAAALEGLQGLSINLSGQSLSEPGLAAELEAMLARHAVPAERVMFEITESASIHELPVAQAFIDTMSRRGCRFALDDFGAGHASFSYLKLLPVDAVKIDGLFVRDILANPADQAMVRSINEIAQLLGKHTVAEFVEDDEVRALLDDIGVDYVQGFGVARPVPLDSLAGGG